MSFTQQDVDDELNAARLIGGTGRRLLKAGPSLMGQAMVDQAKRHDERAKVIAALLARETFSTEG